MVFSFDHFKDFVDISIICMPHESIPNIPTVDIHELDSRTCIIDLEVCVYVSVVRFWRCDEI